MKKAAKGDTNLKKTACNQSATQRSEARSIQISVHVNKSFAQALLRKINIHSFKLLVRWNNNII